MKTKIELIETEEIINSIQNENELFNKIMPFIKSVEKFTFMNSKFTGSFDCKKLQTVGNGAFYYSEFNGEFNCPDLQEVGKFAFCLSQFTGNFNCPNLQTVGNYAFFYSQFNGVFNCPNLTDIGKYAFANSNFDTITIGAKAILNIGCIGAHSAKFRRDYEANGKQAGTYVWNGTNWIYQK